MGEKGGGGGVAEAREQRGAGECEEFKQYGRCGWFERNGPQCKYTHGRSEGEERAAAGRKRDGGEREEKEEPVKKK